MSLFPNCLSVNKIDFPKSLSVENALFLAEEFLRILEKTDQDHYRRPRKTDEKHQLEYPHCEHGKVHIIDFNVTRLAIDQPPSLFRLSV